MTFIRFTKILILGLGLSIVGRYGAITLEEYRQNRLANEICGLVSLPLETGLLRDVYEGLENSLKNRGEVNTCVSVTDNGRSYSPECSLAGASYRTVMCKAEGNIGVRAAMSFESGAIWGRELFYLWIGLSALILALITVSNFLAKYVVAIYSDEVKGLIFESSTVDENRPSWPHRIARLTMTKAGISKSLSDEATRFRAQLRDFEKKIEHAASMRSRLEQEAISSQAYVDKVKQIRHDIRSPLSSLQAIYEKLKVDEVATTKALATAIRRIQLLIDDLNQVDREKEEPRLVIAEVVAEEIVLLMASKFSETKSATLTVEYRAESLSPIKVGKKEFHGAIENLLENSLEAISLGGTVKVTIHSDAGLCKISVEDDGCGISNDDIPKLFTRGGSFKKINGLGLGLYHTKQNIESWGGTIECAVLPRGTRFTISLPLMQTGVIFSGLPPDHCLKLIDDDQATAKALTQTGFKIIESAVTYEEGKKVLAGGTSETFSILVDQRLDGDLLGTDLIAQQFGRQKIFLCTHDFDNLELIKLARQIGVKVIPKPLCHFGAYRAEVPSSSLA